jgi:hypothetical protein
MSTIIDISCNILDDSELEKLDSIKVKPIELRHWIPDTIPKENPFERGFIKSSYSFPKAFQNKGYSEEFPPLVQRITTNMSTTNLLQRVKEKLEKAPPLPSSTTSFIPIVTYASSVVAPPAAYTPPYPPCTPDNVSHTPPYIPY